MQLLNLPRAVTGQPITAELFNKLVDAIRPRVEVGGRQSNTMNLQRPNFGNGGGLASGSKVSNATKFGVVVEAATTPVGVGKGLRDDGETEYYIVSGGVGKCVLLGDDNAELEPLDPDKPEDSYIEFENWCTTILGVGTLIQLSSNGPIKQGLKTGEGVHANGDPDAEIVDRQLIQGVATSMSDQLVGLDNYQATKVLFTYGSPTGNQDEGNSANYFSWRGQDCQPNQQ